MGLETFTDIKSLNELWPLGADSKSQGDDHLRGIKKVLKAEFASGGVAKTAQTRSRIVNGAMQISQENGDTASGTTGYYAADQWTVSQVTAATPSFQRYGALVSPNGSKYRILVGFSVADTSIAAGDLYAFGQSVEGVRIADFRWGTASAKQVVLRFWVRSTIAGTFGGSIVNAASNRSYPFSYTIGAGEAGTDVMRSVVIPGDTAGTWPTDTGKGLQVWFSFMAGTSFTAAPSVWTGGAYYAPTGITNGLASTANQFHLMDVGLYLDPDATGVAPPWQMPDEAEELAACQRYFMTAPGLSYYAAPRFTNDVYRSLPVQFPTWMRALPAVTALGKIDAGAPASIAVDHWTRFGMTVVNSVVTTTAVLTVTGWTANARM